MRIRKIYMILLFILVISAVLSLTNIFSKYNSTTSTMPLDESIVSSLVKSKGAVSGDIKSTISYNVLGSEEIVYDQGTGKRKQYIRIDKDPEGNIIKKHEYSYDSDGRVLSSVRTNMDPSGKVSSITEFTNVYDARTGLNIGYSRVDKDPDGVVLGSSEYAYDKDGRITGFIRVSRGASGDISNIVEHAYTYDDVTGKKTNFTRFLKDSEGNVKREENFSYSPVNGMKTVYVRKDLDGQGNVIMEDVYTFNPETGRKETYASVIRDASGNIVDGYDYLYDSSGRVLSFTRQLRDKSGNVIFVSELVYRYDPATGKRTGSSQVKKDPSGNVLVEDLFTYDASTGKRKSYVKKEKNQEGAVLTEDEYLFDPSTGTKTGYKRVHRDGSGNITKSYDYRYDADGRVTGYTRINWDKNKVISSREYTYSYDVTTGKTVAYASREKDSSGAVIRSDIYEYDPASGVKVKYLRSERDSSRDLVIDIEYVYDSSGRTISFKKSAKDRNGTLANYQEHGSVYDSAGGMVKMVDIRKENGIFGENIYTYDPASGKKASYVRRDKDASGQVLREYSHKYDSSGRVISFVQRTMSASGIMYEGSENVYEYDKETGKRIKYIKREKGDKGVILREDGYSYDAKTGAKMSYYRLERDTSKNISRLSEYRYGPDGKNISQTKTEKGPDGKVLSTDEYSYSFDKKTGKKTGSTHLEKDPSGKPLREDIYTYDGSTGKETGHTTRTKDYVSGDVREDIYTSEPRTGKKVSYSRKIKNSSGNVIESETCDYDNEARVIRREIKEFSASGSSVGFTEYLYEYDGTSGLKTGYIFRKKDADGKIIRSDSAKYDAKNGNEVSFERSEIDQKTGISKSESHAFDPASGQKLYNSSETRDGRGNILSAEKYSYDALGRIISHIKSKNGEDGKLSAIEEYSYLYDPASGQKLEMSTVVKNALGKVTRKDLSTFNPETGYKTSSTRVDYDESGRVVREEEYKYHPETGRNKKYTRRDTNSKGIVIKDISLVYSSRTGRKLRYSRLERDEDGELLKNHVYDYDYDEYTGAETGYTLTEKDEKDNVVNVIIYSFDETGKPDYINSSPAMMTNKRHYVYEYSMGGKKKKKEFDLNEGVNDLTIRDVDSSGKPYVFNFQVTLDSVPPLIDAYPIEVTSKPEYTLIYLVDGVPKNKTFQLEEGINKIVIEEFDQAGNKTGYMFNLTMDSIPPVIVPASPDFTSEQEYTFNYTVDGVDKSRVFTLKEGKNQIDLMETDSAGNISFFRHDVTLDSVPPVINADPRTSTNEPLYSLDYTVDGVPKTKDFILDEGINHLELTETDEAGNESERKFDVFLDSTPPSIIASPEKMTNKAEYELKYIVDGSEKVKNFTLEEGENELQVVEKDQAGNEGIYSFIVTLDTEPPRGILNVNSGSDRTSAQSITFDMNFSDDGSGVADWRSRVDENKWSQWKKYPPAKEDTTLSLDNVQGQHTVFVQCRDNSGNVEEYNDSVFLDLWSGVGVEAMEVNEKIYSEGEVYFVRGAESRIIDMIDVMPAGGSGDFTAYFEITNIRTGITRTISMPYPLNARDSMAFDLSDDGKPFRTAFNTDEIVLRAKFRDNQTGDESPWSESMTFRIDEEGPEGAVMAGKKAIEINAVDEGAGVSAWRYRIDKGEWSKWASYPPSDDQKKINSGDLKGEHLVFVELKDNIGNVESVSTPADFR